MKFYKAQPAAVLQFINKFKTHKLLRMSERETDRWSENERKRWYG